MSTIQLNQSSIVYLCKEILRRNADRPSYAALAVRELLAVTGVNPKSDPELQSLLADLPLHQGQETLTLEQGASLDSPQEEQFRKEIIDFYIPRQLVDAIIANGGIPKDSIETQIGVGFIDVADYTFLAKFLSPKENQFFSMVFTQPLPIS